MSTTAEYDYELAIQRDITQAYIDTDPTDVVFSPRIKIPDGSGGYTWTTPAPLQPQRIRVITNAATRTGSATRTIEGVSVTPDLLLLCLWDAVVYAGYQLTLGEDLYEVIYVSSDLKYEKTAEVIRR